MSLIPKITTEFNPDNQSLTITDVTGLYDAATNPSGWGAPNTERNNAKVYLIFQRDKEILERKDVSSIVAAEAGEEIVFENYFEGQLDQDSVYRVFYQVADQTTEESYYSFGQVTFVFEDIKEKISEFWVKLACIYDIYIKKELEQECIWLESNLAGLQNLKERGRESEFLSLLSFIQKRIDVNISKFL